MRTDIKKLTDSKLPAAENLSPFEYRSTTQFIYCCIQCVRCRRVIVTVRTL